ncbi:hypothetical protein CQW23_18306 [Capsicum baccatum]|uniref:Ultraviolet-B receptor UVR8 n=1 Tax=Capsicum baccatum TaxID=33114 RepID=A0A2G2WGC0_CAPBA|nr:hypothetical protein CQW23_18306 [Capsicum baccatum]PHU13196.1 hypothetical protein BC332_20126 [Capsicum chinense]
MMILRGVVRKRSFVRCISGFAAVWGNGDYGRLGHGNVESRWSPNPLPSSAFDNQSLRQIACGGAHTLFLTENGRVYASGLNDYGQLGVSDDRDYITVRYLDLS